MFAQPLQLLKEDKGIKIEDTIIITWLKSQRPYLILDTDCVDIVLLFLGFVVTWTKYQ